METLRKDYTIMHERQFQGKASRLRDPERVALLEVDRVVALGTEGLKPGVLLDVGTGTGLFAEAFSKAGWVATGTDLNADLLALAREAVPDAAFQECPAEKLPFADGSFDVVFLGHLLHEVEGPVDALKEARRAARSRVVVLEWPYQEEEQGPPLAHRLRPASILRMADAAGFQGGERIKLGHMDLYRLTP
jgi:ubiquinone/menaquinone biosynthesis C-methylase UbiE